MVLLGGAVAQKDTTLVAIGHRHTEESRVELQHYLRVGDEDPDVSEPAYLRQGDVSFVRSWSERRRSARDGIQDECFLHPDHPVTTSSRPSMSSGSRSPRQATW